MRYTLRKYISVDEVFNRVSASLKSYFDSDIVVIDDYYKVIDLCNAQMGLRLNPKKEAILTLENYSAELPSDFLLLDLALLIRTDKGSYTIGVKKTETLVGLCPTDYELSIIDNPCCKFKLNCGRKPTLICETEEVTVEFNETYIARLSEKRYLSDDCFNLNSNSPFMMEIKNNQIFTDGVEKGKIYVLYTATMNDEDNIPTCLDNPIVLEYYEQALRYRILEDLYINKKADVAQALNLVRQEYLIAKSQALSLVGTPEFHELLSVNNALKREYRRYNYLIY